MSPPHRSSPDFGNGDRAEIPAGKSAEEYTRIAANSALNCEYAIGAMMRELASTRTSQATFQTAISAFMLETRDSFKQLGVKVRKSERRIEARVDEIYDEVEDTKTRDLRAYKRKYNYWKKTALAGAGGTLIAVLAALILHYIFKVG